MDENTVAGAGERFAGRAERIMGATIGDGASELSGRVRELGGQAQQRSGEAADAVRQVVGGQPLTALFAAGAVGMLMGLFLARR
jgi:ElaB/YqjD/DUF883 family membrane-anchored ribosome-binding protein